MIDCCNQEIIPITGRKLSVRVNIHPNTDGILWGWIDGCTLNICWSDDKKFNYAEANKCIAYFNELGVEK